MSEELLQRPVLGKIGKWDFINIVQTSLKQLKDEGLLKNISYPKYDNRKPDGLIVYKGEVLALVSNKVPKKLNKEKEIKDWVDVVKALNAKLLIITDVVSKTYWVNALTGNTIKDENGNEINTLFDIESDAVPKLIEQILDSVDKTTDQLKKIELKEPTKLARSVWQDIWIASADNPEVCLYTFVELFVFKYLSDLGILTGFNSFDRLLGLYSTNTDEEVLDYYATNIRKEIKNKFETNPEDGTTIINGSTFVNKKGEAVSGYSTAFKKVLLKFKAYEDEYGKFDHIHYEFKSKLFETFLKESISKKNWGQYFTPLKVVRAIVKMAKSDVKENASICDPACGVGKFLLEIFGDNPNKYYYFQNDQLKKKINLIGYDKGFEDKEQKTIILAKSNMLIYLSSLIREYSKNCSEFSTLFNETFKLQTKSVLGTLYFPTKDSYNLILTNPPYVVDGSTNIKDEIKKAHLQYHYNISCLGIEGLFVQWIIKALKPDGKAFIVLPQGVFDRIPDRKLRKYITDECIIDGIISLPKKTFFRNPKKTYVLAITKKGASEKDKAKIQEEPVFTYLVSTIGETLDIYRFELPNNNDLESAANLFNQFKNDKHHFKTEDPRCRIHPAKIFTDSQDNWDIDKLWSKDEKVHLGIEKQQNVLSVQEYVDSITKYNEILDKYKREISNLIDEKNKYIYAEISLLDNKYFQLTRGKRITRREINANIGDIPVYSSSQDESSVLGYMSESYLKENDLRLFDSPAILFNLDGSVGYSFIRNKPKYSFIDVVAALRPLDKNIDMEYLRIQLEKGIALSGASYSTKLYFGKIANYKITIKIPVDNKGKFDLALQKRLAQKYNLFHAIKTGMQERTKYLVETNIIF